MNSTPTRMRYRGRFAPSPTGQLHLGLARTALLGYLRARSERGAFVVRIEDIDGPRVVAGAADALLDDLRWLGITWDEGPDVGGPFGPYTQSQRSAHYEAALAQLAAGGLTFRCSCSRKEIVASAPHGPSEFGPPYPGTCRLGPARPEAPCSLRLRVAEPLPSFLDGILGCVEPEARGDFVLRRADGLFSYQLAVVVDDIAMGITEVLRGADLAGCTGWQIALYRALGAQLPSFVHVPLLLGPDGKRLAKRSGAEPVAGYRARGTRPEALVGWLAATAGLVPAGTEISADELLADFSLERVAHGDTHLTPAEFP
ncbi:MAG: tRNA glutamyl-Q(34) synthetase GluQRS [Myxococcales bacterium]